MELSEYQRFGKPHPPSGAPMTQIPAPLGSLAFLSGCNIGPGIYKILRYICKLGLTFMSLCSDCFS